MSGTRCEVAVIGAGIVGTVCACYLRREGRDVTLLDRAGPGEATSFGNAGGIGPSSVIPIATPGMLKQIPKWLLDPAGPLHLRWSYLPHVLPWLIRFLRAGAESKVRRISAALAALNSETFQAYAPLLEEAGLKHLIRRDGHLFVYRAKGGLEDDALGIELRRDLGFEMHVLGADEIHQLEPALARIFECGVFFPDGGLCTNPFGLVRGLAEHFRNSGGTLLRREVRGFEMGPTGPRRILTDDGDLDAERVVIAAGIHSTVFTRQLGYSVPLESHRGYHVTLPDPGVMPQRLVFPADYKFAITPMDMGLRFAGTVELAGIEAPPNFERARTLLRIGRRVLPDLRADVHSEWMGHRPCLPDSLPVLGVSPRHENVYFAFGHGHEGLVGASKTGQLIADLIGGRPPSIDLTPFRIDRF